MAAVSGSISLFTSVLKELYQGQKPQELGYKDFPLLAMMKKNEKLGGKYFPVPAILAPSGGISNKFVNAQGNQNPPRFVEFQITTTDIYSLATIDNKLALAARNDQQSFVNALKVSTDQAIAAASKYLALSMYRTGAATLGVVSAIASGVITLTNRSDVVNFEVGMALNASTGGTLATTTVTTSSGTTPTLAWVIARDPVADTITIGPAYNSATSAAANPSAGYIYGTSNSQSWAAGDALCIDGGVANNMYGLQSWLPSTAPGTSDSFFGVNRSPDRQRLAGTYYDGSNKLVIEAITNALSLAAECGGKPTHGFLSFSSYQAAVNEISQKATVEYTQLKGKDIDIGFEGIKIHGPRGPVILVPDAACPAQSCFLLDMERFWLGSIDKAPAIFDTDGMPMLRVASADQMEMRVGSYAQVYTDSPVSHAHVTLSV